VNRAGLSSYESLFLLESIHWLKKSNHETHEIDERYITRIFAHQADDLAGGRDAGLHPQVDPRLNEIVYQPEYATWKVVRANQVF
jgi:hypothetical protein